MHLSATLGFYLLVIEMVDSYKYLCSAGGSLCSHSIEFLVCVGNSTFQLDKILAQIISRNIITLTSESVDPMAGIMFHVV